MPFIIIVKIYKIYAGTNHPRSTRLQPKTCKKLHRKKLLHKRVTPKHFILGQPTIHYAYGPTRYVVFANDQDQYSALAGMLRLKTFTAAVVLSIFQHQAQR